MSSSVTLILMAPLLCSETDSKSSMVSGMYVWPAIPPYNVSISKESVFSDTSSLPMAHVEVELLEGILGAHLLTHLQTCGSEQYGAPEPFFQCWAQAHQALAGKSAC